MPSRTTAAVGVAVALAVSALAPACFLNSTAYESASGATGAPSGSGGTTTGGAGTGAAAGGTLASSSGGTGGTGTTGGSGGTGGPDHTTSSGTGGSGINGDECPGITTQVAVYMTVTITADTTKAAPDYGATTCGGGMGRDMVYQVTALSKGYLTASLDKKESFADSFLYFRSICGDQQSQKGCSDDQVTVPVEKDEVIYVVVDGHGDKAAGKFKLQLYLDGCQNGILETPDEECDDGNAIENDQCTHDCKVRCTGEGSGFGGADVDTFVHPMTHHCYLQIYPNADWQTAKDTCAKWGGYLAALTPKKEIDDLSGLLKKNGEDCWIGGDDKAVRGTYLWIDGEPWTYVNGSAPWHDGEPNNNTDEDCIEIYGDGTMNDENCDHSENSLCERDPQGMPPPGG